MQISLTPATLYTCYDIGHLHEDFQDAWDGGNMDGAYDETVYSTSCSNVPTDPMYAYADNSGTTIPAHEVQPYIDIAKAYGFGNYMFQTNQGPSFPAHQFLFSGTSAPVYDIGGSTPYWEWFATDNPAPSPDTTGCLGPPGQIEPQIDEKGKVHSIDNMGWTPSDPSGANAGYPCFQHNTLANVLDPAGVTWKYYTTSTSFIWTAPVAIEDMCEPTAVGGPCTNSLNSDWANVIQEVSPHAARIMEDIENCNLANVSFVTPDGAWSDHAGKDSSPPALGPSWVADIVDLVGNATTCDPNQQGGKSGHWNDTVILITWDDWGGWYDHVEPPLPSAGNFGYFDGSGQYYVYGFRVPLFVVSAYMAPANTGGTGGYVSGAWNTGGSAPTACPLSTTPQYCHDFGSILNFIEYVFGNNGRPLSEIYAHFPYADHFALDGPNYCTTCTYSLADFFKFSATASTFVSISPGSEGTTTFNAQYFINYSGSPQDPDEDASEN